MCFCEVTLLKSSSCMMRNKQDLSQNRHAYDLNNVINECKLKKKNTLSQSLREFFKPTRHAFFLFLFYFIFYFNWPLPPRTSETKNDWKVSTSVFSEIKRDFTRFLSSHVLKFFQNSKLSSFFVVKMKKNIISRKKMKVWILQNQMRTENQCGRQLWDTEFFFLALSW